MTEVKDDIIESAKKDETVEKTTDTETDKKVEEEKNKDDKKEVPDYRPKADEKQKGFKEAGTVPLKKYLDVKNRLKELKEVSKTSNNLSNADIESLAKEHNLDADVLKAIAAIIKKETIAEAEKKITPLLEKARREESEKAFEKDFKQNILSKYPELKSKKEHFKRIAFSPDFLHLKTLEDIRKEYFDGYKPSDDGGKKDDKKDTVEGGSKGGAKGSETIDFANMTDEQHSKVLADPKLKAEYYKWKDANGR
ncbi:MAG: hypothetical protein CSYNP_03120 [Syntrophus sp. SKADARSKE-3]|nr:hypothetical protein [Syntrophus sp. SKADARSKE-3]